MMHGQTKIKFTQWLINIGPTTFSLSDRRRYLNPLQNKTTKLLSHEQAV